MTITEYLDGLLDRLGPEEDVWDDIIKLEKLLTIAVDGMNRWTVYKEVREVLDKMERVANE